MLQVTAVSRSLQLEGLNLECGAAERSPLGAEGVEGDPEIFTLEDEANEDDYEDEDEDEDEERKAEYSLVNLIDLLPSYYCGDDIGSGSSCDAESPEEEEEDGEGDETGEGERGGPGGGQEGREIPPPSPSSSFSSTTTVEGTVVRLRRPCLPSPDDAGRRELLQQMLTTKSLLEKKQRNRRSGAGAWAVTAGEVENEYDRAQHEAQQSALRKAVILRQRKNSTAIKMATLERQQSSKGKKQKLRKQRGKSESGGGNGGGGIGGALWDSGGDLSGGGVGGVKAEDVSHQLEALRRRLSALDSELRESKQDTERTLQDLQHRREQELHLIKDLGGVTGDVSLVGGAGGLLEMSLLKGSNSGGGGSLMGSLSSIPSIIVPSSTSEKKTSEKIFGIKVGGGKEGRSKARNPLHFLDLKLRVSRRHKSTECLSGRGSQTPDRSHNSTPGNGSFSDNSSDDETDSQPRQQQQQSPSAAAATPQEQQVGCGVVRTEISMEALREIEAFKQLIHRYFATHPRHDSITAHSREILL